MVLEFKELRPSAQGYRLSAGTLKITSEFDGRSRKPDAGELSVQCSLSLVTSTAGALAPASPPGDLLVDGREYPVKPAFPGESGYRSKSKSGELHESLAFRIATKDLLSACKGSSVSLRLGTVKLVLTPPQLSDLREFVARMDPNP